MLTDLKSRCGQGCILFWRLKRECFSAFPRSSLMPALPPSSKSAVVGGVLCTRHHSDHASVLTSPLTLSAFSSTFVHPSNYHGPNWIIPLLWGQLISSLNVTSPSSLAFHGFQDWDVDIFGKPGFCLPDRGKSMEMQMWGAEFEALGWGNHRPLA